MLRNSFIFLDKVSHATEKKIWRQNIKTWEQFLEAKEIAGFGSSRKIFCDQQIKKAKEAAWNQDASMLKSLFPHAEHWRLYDYFKEDVCFLDIETSGYYGDITVVGIYDGKETKSMVKGKNLDPYLLAKLLREYKLLVTFNGASFDLPVINKYYPNTIPNIPHIDLRHPLAKLGFTGGLKQIEKELGIRRAKEVQGMHGGDAVTLWHLYKATGEEKYLERIVQYNEEDIINLKPLAEFVYEKMKEKIFLYSE
ncbi:ribonuclease H-like domain-containing protein [Candidatus Woesearchaeota archaeon]|nr:ribonuclease H-like domain-containing protein [Candidatus Woesearchaeota archaeon]